MTDMTSTIIGIIFIIFFIGIYISLLCAYFDPKIEIVQVGMTIKKVVLYYNSWKGDGLGRKCVKLFEFK